MNAYDEIYSLISEETIIEVTPDKSAIQWNGEIVCGYDICKYILPDLCSVIMADNNLQEYNQIELREKFEEHVKIELDADSLPIVTLNYKPIHIIEILEFCAPELYKLACVRAEDSKSKLDLDFWKNYELNELHLSVLQNFPTVTSSKFHKFLLNSKTAKDKFQQAVDVWESLIYFSTAVVFAEFVSNKLIAAFKNVKVKDLLSDKLGIRINAAKTLLEYNEIESRELISNALFNKDFFETLHFLNANFRNKMAHVQTHPNDYFVGLLRDVEPLLDKAIKIMDQITVMKLCAKRQNCFYGFTGYGWNSSLEKINIKLVNDDFADFSPILLHTFVNELGNKNLVKVSLAPFLEIKHVLLTDELRMSFYKRTEKDNLIYEVSGMYGEEAIYSEPKKKHMNKLNLIENIGKSKNGK